MLSLPKQTGLVLATVVLLFSQALAMDYPTLTTGELYELRGAIKNAPEVEQKSYQKEWQLRLSNMTEKERKQYASETEASKKSQKPVQPGRGYENQGTGVIIYGGGTQ